eukprot:m.118422 g.118422  ORF g.118422 m.118422 type:complete len:78 (-) comp16430_c1_seq4:193-426(-)
MAPRTLCPVKIRKGFKKRNSNVRLGKNVDKLIFLECMLFLKAMAQEATAEAHMAKDHTLQPAHIEKVQQRVLKQFKG